MSQRNLLSTKNSTNTLLFVVGGMLFLAGGDAIALPGLIAMAFGLLGYFKNRKFNKTDETTPWAIIILIVLVSLGLLSTFILVGSNPYKLTG